VSGVLADSVGVFAVTFNFFGSGYFVPDSVAGGVAVGVFSFFADDVLPCLPDSSHRSHRHQLPLPYSELVAPGVFVQKPRKYAQRYDVDDDLVNQIVSITNCELPNSQARRRFADFII
jgi:hypothetical protein